ncbi:MAG: DUF2085 domain-containing protein [Clostridia bacterium]|nr:DUF2085 domain-containing protein [Clostridia bacterium]
MEYGHRIGCHQMPERSFFLNGYQFPVCARCTGVILGEIIAVILILLGIRFNIVVSIFLLLIMGFDWFIQFIKILQSNNARRLITGVTGGIGLTYIYYYLLVYIIEVVKNFLNKY